ncbi:MAG TPA: FHA domain-containing protein [Thermoanaerobaculia bacterium]|nr:FHA domain-containing protein [Thermoanaerobaculia bacterium]
MELTVRHLSGSRAGQEQTFRSETITIGRNPTSSIAFDAERDLAVSGRHAEVVLRDRAWVLRDLGSSNGTFVGSERITERPLRPGEIVQLGKNGPRIEFVFRVSPTTGEVEPTIVVPTDMENVPMEGRTVAMMMQSPPPPSAAAGGIPVPPVMPKQRKGIKPVFVILGSLVLIVGLLIAGLAAIIFMKARAQRSEIASEAASIQQVEEEKVAEANRLREELVQQREIVSQTEEQLKAAQVEPPSGAAAETGTDGAELERQLAESQRMLEEVTRQLQMKNDEIVKIRTQPPPTVRPTPVSGVRTATAKPVKKQQTPATTSPPPPAAAEVQPPANLITGKQLKRLIGVRAIAPEVPPADLPDRTGDELAQMIQRSLITLGDIAPDDSGIASVAVSVINYQAGQRTNVNLRSASEAASRIGSLAGESIPRTPVNVTSITFDSSMSIRVRMLDRSGGTVAEATPASAAKGTRSSVSLDGVPFSQVFGSDTPPGDVARDVVGQAVEAISAQVRQMEWSTAATRSSDPKKVTLRAGRNANVEIGDVFKLVDRNRAVANVRVVELGDATSTAEVLDGDVRSDGLRAHYLGFAGTSPSALTRGAGPKHVRMRSNADAHQGPGKSFPKVKGLRRGARAQLHYTVGIWAKVSDAKGTFWVPLTAAGIE